MLLTALTERPIVAACLASMTTIYQLLLHQSRWASICYAWLPILVVCLHAAYQCIIDIAERKLTLLTTHELQYCKTTYSSQGGRITHTFTTISSMLGRIFTAPTSLTLHSTVALLLLLFLGDMPEFVSRRTGYQRCVPTHPQRHTLHRCVHISVTDMFYASTTHNKPSCMHQPNLQPNQNHSNVVYSGVAV